MAIGQWSLTGSLRASRRIITNHRLAGLIRPGRLNQFSAANPAAVSNSQTYCYHSYRSLLRAPAQPTPSSCIDNQLKYHSIYHSIYTPLFTSIAMSFLSPFPEEQLDSPLGYFSAQPGQTLKDGTWTIIHKLGWGPRSSTWLIIDTAP